MEQDIEEKTDRREEEHVPRILQERRKCIMSIGGAYNPVHTQHIAMMNLAKDYLEREMGFQIVAGLLAVATDGYVKGKLKGEAIKSQHRLKMCALAMEGHDWLKPTPKPYGSAKPCAKAMMPSIDPSATIMVLVGADRAISKGGIGKWRRKITDEIHVCIGRPGLTDHIKREYRKDLEKGLIPSPENFVVVPIETEDVSSTLVRKSLRVIHETESLEAKAECMKRELIDKGLLAPSVGQYILNHERDLYF